MKKASIIIGALVVVIALLLSAYINLAVLKEGTGNGSSARWGKQEQRFADEMCANAETDEEKVMVFYHWIIENIEYDYEYDMAYQHFDVARTLETKKGVCFDYANLFAVFCRSQNIKCYVVDGYLRKDRSAQHTWNRVYFDGAWWNLDVTNDAIGYRNGKTPYGFHELESYTQEDPDYVITRVY